MDEARRDPLPEYLTADQVGGMLQLSAKSIYRLAKADPTFPQIKLMGSLRFPRERLMRWLRAREGHEIRACTTGGPAPYDLLPASTRTGAREKGESNDDRPRPD